MAKKLTISGVIGQDYGVTDLLLALQTAGENPRIIIDSDGGYIDEAFRMASIIELSGAHTVARKVYSAANILYFAGATREIEEGGQFMLHNSRVEYHGTADDFVRVAEYLKTEDRRMRDYIASKTAMQDAQLIALMAIDRYIDKAEAEGLGFTNSNVTAVRIAAVHFNKNENMNVKEAFKKFLSVVGKNALALDLNLKDGGVLVVETDDGEVVGKPATVGGEPAPDGTHTLEDGRTVTTAGGIVTSVNEAEGMEDEDEMQAMKEEIETLKAEKKEYEARLAETEAAVTALMKATASKGRPTSGQAVSSQTGKNEAKPTPAPLSAAEKFIENIKNPKA
jgi:ATP-dependent protease ClpP protease subunit